MKIAMNSTMTALLALLAVANRVSSFTARSTRVLPTFHQTVLMASQQETETTELVAASQEENGVVVDTTGQLSIPLTFRELVSQTSEALKDANKAGKTRQMVRVLLPRDPQSGQIGTYLEGGIEEDDNNLMLVPPDESWQGGIMQLYRSASLTCEEILRRVSRNTTTGIAPTLKEDRSIDESGVDGIGLWISESPSSPQDDVSCFVQPSQETIDAIETISKQSGDRLVVLLNPQWRITDDALDKASREENSLFGNLANFLGGKGGSLRRLDEMGFESVYTLEGYVCRGGNVRLIKRFDSDWAVFAENDAATNFIKVGTSKTRPTYQEVDQMLEDCGISLKYARDMGLAPKI